jgi:hypothetical protein
MASCSGSRVSSGKKKLKYNAVCGGNEDLLSALLNEELNIDSEDDVNFEILSECGSEDSSNEVSETESESDISNLRADGWESVTVRDKKPKSYTFTKNAGPQFNLLPDADHMGYFSLFFNDELLNNIETNRYARHKISKLQLGPRSIWNSWSDVSVPEMKAFIGLIINMGIVLLLNLKDYWSSEWTTQGREFVFLHCAGNYTVHFQLMPLLHQLFEQTSLLSDSASI